MWKISVEDVHDEQVSVTTGYDVGKWNFVGFVYESSTNRMMFYVNGQQVGEALFLTIDWTIEAAGGYFIGRHSAECFDGRLFDMDVFCNQWYNRVLSPSEVKAAMRCPWANFPRPVAHVLMDDTSGVSDVSGNSYDATGLGVTSDGQDYSFVGPSSTVTLPDAVSFNNWPYAPLSVFLHLQIDTAPVEFLRLKGTASGTVYWRATINGTHCQFQLRTTSGSYTTVSFADVPELMENVMRYRGFTWDPLTRTLKYFLESVEMGSVTISDDLDVATTDSKIILGKFSGKAAALQVFHSTVSLKHAALLGTWPMTATKAASVYSMNAGYQCTVSSKVVNFDSVDLSSGNHFEPASGNTVIASGFSNEYLYHGYSQCVHVGDGMVVSLSGNSKPSSTESFSYVFSAILIPGHNTGSSLRPMMVFNSASQTVIFFSIFME